jgi:bacillithiol system protein YtxJ
MLRSMPGADAAELIPAEDEAEIDRIIEASKDEPSLLFLHDWSCPISERAEDQILRLAETIHTVDVTRLHELNRYIARVTGVRHESPQVFVFHRGRPVFDASHGRIRADVLRTLLEELRSG